MPNFGSPFQQDPEGARQSQGGADKQAQSPRQGQELQQGFVFHTSNPHVLDFLQLRASGQDPSSNRLKQVRLEMQNWEIGYRGDSEQLRAAMKKTLEAMEAKPITFEEFCKSFEGEFKLPPRPNLTK